MKEGGAGQGPWRVDVWRTGWGQHCWEREMQHRRAGMQDKGQRGRTYGGSLYRSCLSAR